MQTENHSTGGKRQLPYSLWGRHILPVFGMPEFASCKPYVALLELGQEGTSAQKN